MTRGRLGSMKLVVWLSVLTDHQIEMYRALQNQLPSPIRFVVGQLLLDSRSAQGWQCSATEDLCIEVLPKSGWLKAGVRALAENKKATHLFGGLWADRRLFLFLLLGQKFKCDIALMMEPYVKGAHSYFGERPRFADRLKALVRPLAYKVAGALVAKKIVAALAISSEAEQQIRSMGVPAERIFPFGYFVPKVELGDAPRRSPNPGAIRLVFVGSLIERKGLVILLAAMERLGEMGLSVCLDIYGPGNSAAFQLPTRYAEYKGAIPFGRAQQVISGYDLLVLPSLHDGWGVVVNEALLQGVPVLVSDACGAKLLVENSGAGAVFEAGNVCALVETIAKLARVPETLRKWRENANAYSVFITPDIAGRYLYDVVSYATHGEPNRQSAPWLLKNRESLGY